MRIDTKKLLAILLVLGTHFIGSINGASPIRKKRNNPVVGGHFVFNISGEPRDLNPLGPTDVFMRRIFEFSMDSLAGFDPETNQLEPRIAERWEVSENQLEFTFHLRKEATFHDGTPIKAEDVKFSFEAATQNKEKDPWDRLKINIEKVKVIEPFVIRFYAKKKHYKNLEQLGSFSILPRHLYGKQKKFQKLETLPVGAGPYKIESYEKGDRISLKRFDNWYGFKEKHLQGRYNFELMTALFINDETLALKMLEEGELDFSEIRPEAYYRATNHEPWGRKIRKVKSENLTPKSWYFYGWNQYHPLFTSKSVRRALSQLFDRERIKRQLLHGDHKLAASPMWYQSSTAPEGLKPIAFDPLGARALLRDEGWGDADKNGVLEKVINGQLREMKFTLVTANLDYEEIYQIYQQDLKKAGVDMAIKYVDWNELEDLISRGKFEVVAMAWNGGDEDQDPHPIWHSSSTQNGYNFVGYKNPLVDRLIDEARQEINVEKRKGLLKKIYQTIADDIPYTFWFHRTHEFYAVSSRIQRPFDSQKYSLGIPNWWLP